MNRLVGVIASSVYSDDGGRRGDAEWSDWSGLWVDTEEDRLVGVNTSEEDEMDGGRRGTGVNDWSGL